MDLISRQDFDKFLEDAEKEAVKNRKHVFASALNTIRGNLRIFPAAQPEKRTQERTETHSCDLISRQSVIDELHKLFKDGFEEDKWWNSTHVLAAIKGLPSVQPEQKKGKWKRTYLDHEAMGERPSIFYCSECAQCVAYPLDYCPNCGARMER